MKNIGRLAIGLLGSSSLLAFVVACSSAPDAPRAQSGAAVRPTDDPSASAGATTTTLPFDQRASKIAWTGAKVTGSHDGGFGAFTGTVDLVDRDPVRSRVRVEIDIASITSDNDRLTGHLKSPDLFDVARFPHARFTSTSIRAGAAGGATHTVTGNLELHGVTRAITFPATIRVADDRVDVDAAFSINRREFGINYPGMPNDLIRDDVALRLTIRARSPEAS